MTLEPAISGGGDFGMPTGQIPPVDEAGPSSTRYRVQPTMGFPFRYIKLGDRTKAFTCWTLPSGQKTCVGYTQIWASPAGAQLLNQQPTVYELRHTHTELFTREQTAQLALLKPPAPVVDLRELAKLYRGVATVGFPVKFKANATGKFIWANLNGAALLRKQPAKYTFILNDVSLWTPEQAAAVARLKPVAVAPDLRELAKVMRGTATQGFPAKFHDTKTNKFIWTNNVNVFKGYPHIKFVAWESHLATPQQNDAWSKVMAATGSQAEAAVPIVGDPASTIVETAMDDDSNVVGQADLPNYAERFGPPLTIPRPADTEVIAAKREVYGQLADLTYHEDGAVTTATARDGAVQDELLAEAGFDLAPAQSFIKRWGLPLGLGAGALVLLSLVRR